MPQPPNNDSLKSMADGNADFTGDPQDQTQLINQKIKRAIGNPALFAQQLGGKQKTPGVKNSSLGSMLAKAASAKKRKGK